MLILYIILLFLSLYLLYVITDFLFIPSLDRLGHRWGLSSDISGSTLMAAGSSAPELAVMIISVMKTGHHEAIGVGTIVGSALFNLFVITGVVMIVKEKVRLSWQPMFRDLFFYAVTIGLMIWAFHDGDISLTESFTFLAVYGLYLVFMVLLKRKFPYEEKEAMPGDNEHTDHWWLDFFHRFMQRAFTSRNMHMSFLISIGIISFLAWVLVESAIVISKDLGVPELFIALVVIAVGTSVPDLVSSVVVARQGRAGMAINNAIGSNIFDILIGLGLPFFLYHLFSAGTITVVRTDLWLSFAFLMGSILFLLLFFLLGRWVTRRSIGILLILLYTIYLVLEVNGMIAFNS